MKKANENYETHHLFPSGEWEGFYTYQIFSQNYRGLMSFYLLFQKQTVEGEGIDSVGRFAWKGTYDTKEMTCQMTKYYYGKHKVFYDGQVDENGIWGTWKITDNWKGGFHIWPKGQGQEAIEEVKEAVVKEGKDLIFVPVNFDAAII